MSSKKSASAAAAASAVVDVPDVAAVQDSPEEKQAIDTVAVATDTTPLETEDEGAEGAGSLLDAAVSIATTNYQAQVVHYQTVIASAKAGVALAKSAFKDLLRNIKLSNKKARKVNPRSKGPHGLSVEVGISPEMEEFLGKPPGTKMSRPQVGREISVYCIKNGLRGEAPESGKKQDNRILRTDEALRKLLSPVPEDKPLHYFNLQHYIKHHFLKAVPAVADPETETGAGAEAATVVVI